MRGINIIRWLNIVLLLGVLLPVTAASRKLKPMEYVILCSREVMNDSVWMQVVRKLQQKHQAECLIYEQHPEELLEELQKIHPRYVAVVEKPERLNRDFIIKGHQLSRKMDDDIFADYLWGVITGYDATDALRMVENSSRPFIIHSALSTTGEVARAKWFDRLVWLDDGTKGVWGEKTGNGRDVQIYHLQSWQLLAKFREKWIELDPDLIITSSHATEKNLEMPFSTGDVRCRHGELYASFVQPEYFPHTAKPRVYFPAGNCLIGNVDNSRESMAVAWMKGGGATAMLGYVVPTWYGRNGWGALKYWMRTPGELTLAEAVYLNQQDIVFQQYSWDTRLLECSYEFDKYGGFAEEVVRLKMKEKLQKTEISKDELGFVHERDVLAYYGDPKWDVRLQEIPGEKGYEISMLRKRKDCRITIRTNEQLDMIRVNGDGIKEQHVGKIPLAYFFPERMEGWELASGQKWKVALDENFILIYDAELQPLHTYTIDLKLKKKK